MVMGLGFLFLVVFLVLFQMYRNYRRVCFSLLKSWCNNALLHAYLMLIFQCCKWQLSKIDLVWVICISSLIFIYLFLPYRRRWSIFTLRWKPSSIRPPLNESRERGAGLKWLTLVSEIPTQCVCKYVCYDRCLCRCECECVLNADNCSSPFKL